jgi:hypothetical protein
MDLAASRIARYKKSRYVQFENTLTKAAYGSIDRAKVKNCMDNYVNRIMDVLMNSVRLPLFGRAIDQFGLEYGR